MWIGRGLKGLRFQRRKRPRSFDLGLFDLVVIVNHGLAARAVVVFLLDDGVVRSVGSRSLITRPPDFEGHGHLNVSAAPIRKLRGGRLHAQYLNCGIAFNWSLVAL